MFFAGAGLLPFAEFDQDLEVSGFLHLVVASAFGRDYLTASPRVVLELTDGIQIYDMLDLEQMFGAGTGHDHKTEPWTPHIEDVPGTDAGRETGTGE
ncbi:MAG: hypothetical protein EYC70_16640 [Planctomycetota bacterium]|nr:MAG: hypothetical protein EYC70_16640 [Planctomycetota bacterium]